MTNQLSPVFWRKAVSRDQKPVRGRIILTLLIFIPLILSACIPTIGTSPTARDAGEFAKGKIVRGFGGNVPLYKEAVPVETYASGDAFGGSFISEDSFSKVFKYYQEILPKLGWETETSSQSESNYVFDIKNQEYRGWVIVNVAADGKKTAITIAVSQR